MGIKCAIKICSSRFNKAGCRHLRFFRFPYPSQLDRIMKWKLACGDNDIMVMDPVKLYNYARICSLHFEEHLMKRHSLNDEAVPTLNLKIESSYKINEEHSYFMTQDLSVGSFVEIDNNKQENSTRSIGCQTEELKVNVGTQTHFMGKSDCQTQTDMRLSARTPRKLKLFQKIKILDADKKKGIKETRRLKIEFSKQIIPSANISKESFTKACDEHLPPFFGKLAKEVSSFKDKKLKGRRYTSEFKKFALSVFYHSSKMYRHFVQKYHFPSISTLRRMTGNVQQLPGLNNIMFEHLKIKMNGKGELDKMCVLTMDEVSLKANLYYNRKRDEIIGFEDLGFVKAYKPAKNALVLMARSINQNWKQPMAYFFLNSTCRVDYLKKIITDCIQKMIETGIEVRALISDMGSNFIKLSRQLGISNYNTIFQVNGKKIHYLFDTPHLIKAIRNILIKYTVKFEHQEASWKDIETVYHLEKQRDLKMMPKITEAHIYPTNFQKMRVKYATQVFSSTVVSAISTYIANGQMSTSAVGTANMLEKFDHLFDMLNSSTRGGKNQYKQPYRGEENQKQFLMDMLKIIEEIKVFNHNKKSGKSEITRTFRVMNCFQVTIRGIMNLWEELKKEGVTELKTRRLNQDCLENFFGKIRQQQGNAVNPTPVQFMTAYKKLTSLDLLECSQNFNCESDSDTLLISNMEVASTEETRSSVSKCQFKITNVDFRHNDLPTKNVENYIGGYLMKKCLKKHSCDVCLKFCKSADTYDKTKLFCHFKGDTEKYGKEKGMYGNLLMPEESFINYVSALETVVMNNISSIVLGKVGEILYRKMKIIPFKHPCLQFPYEFMLRLFVRLRTYYIVKYANRKFQNEEMRRRQVRKNRKLDNLRHI